ncbi:agmatinase [Agarilytica rhodophyticola]|uniref:agmatinase n=1 Tax=Agarilytica rhodophyticola TaxID=1737490 RepID=UPI000B34471A|nr:agmatinase [Agarilytica rhodophyticola]
MYSTINDVKPNSVVLLGMPFDDYSSYLKGPAKAPAIIRQMMQCDASNTSTELGRELGDHPLIVDIGDMTWQHPGQAFAVLEHTIAEVVMRSGKPLTFGGDHSITFPILKGLAKHHQDITILHFDAHPDLYDILDNNPLSHACPFARIMENNFARRLVQVGIRTLNQHQREQAERFNVEIYEMKNWCGSDQIKLDGPVYITIDIDALDPAFAPGVSHHEPGGLTVRQILDVIQSIDVPVIGADIVEYNPTRDINDMTAAVVNKLYKEVCGKMLDC